MQYSDAFRKLGYELQAPRLDWTAQNEKGVCITIWKSEMRIADGKPWSDTRLHSDDNAVWRDKPGNRKRIRHLGRAIREFGGIVDVVIVHGTPGAGYDRADPWLPAERKGFRWRIVFFDPETGHYEARLIEPSANPDQ